MNQSKCDVNISPIWHMTLLNEHDFFSEKKAFNADRINTTIGLFSHSHVQNHLPTYDYLNQLSLHYIVDS